MNTVKMKIVYNDFLPFKGYKCINLFGILFVRNGTVMSDEVLNHEAIHTAQMKELWYIGFYLLYVFEFLIKLILIRNWHKAYRDISFEQEAFKNENDMDYLLNRKPYEWKKYW